MTPRFAPLLAFTQDVSVSMGLVALVCVVGVILFRRKSGPRWGFCSKL